MNWDDLRFILAIARQGSLAGAARQLGVNHSTVFRRLNGVEEVLATRLFERLPTGYLPTAAGERLLERAERMDREAEGLAREVAGLDRRLSGTVRLTTTASLAYYHVAPCLRAFHQDYPGVTVELVVSAENRDLSRREADLALRATTRPPEHLVGRRCVSISWWLCAGKSWLAEHAAPTDMAALAGLPMIGPDESLSRLPAFSTLARQLPSPLITCRAGDLDTMAHLAVAGLGIALLPQDQAHPELVRLFPMTPAVQTELWLLTHPDLRGVPRIRALMDALAGALAGDPRLSSQ